MLGVALIVLGLAVLRSGAVSRWTGTLAILSGLAHFTTGVAIGSNGFEGTVKESANLVSWASLLIFAIAVTVAAWWPPPTGHRPRRAARRGGQPGTQRSAAPASLINT